MDSSWTFPAFTLSELLNNLYSPDPLCNIAPGAPPNPYLSAKAARASSSGDSVCFPDFDFDWDWDWDAGLGCLLD